MCVDSGARAWVESNTITAALSYLTPEDKEAIKTSLLSGGLAGPLCWYTAQLEQGNINEDASANLQNFPLRHENSRAHSFIACAKDCIALPAFGDSSHGKYAKGPVTRKEIEADHWGPMSHAVYRNERDVAGVVGNAVNASKECCVLL
ncbi:Esterase/Lipase [Mycena sanguinolenta]|uniref:Esterase/Lipase n=1 Tax=Mycena sanguinolenta TaxID=230812 RepID=A0A8H6Y017_9AGAR|nr:Esterase/Lipase [Mycena sanguinolenta]